MTTDAGDAKQVVMASLTREDQSWNKYYSYVASVLGPGPYHLSDQQGEEQVHVRERDTVDGDGFQGFVYPAFQILLPGGHRGGQRQPERAAECRVRQRPLHRRVSASPTAGIVYKLRHKLHLGSRWDDMEGPAGEPRLPAVNSVETTTANGILTGQYNEALITGPDVSRLASTSSLTHYAVPATGTDPLVFSMLPGHSTDDIKVRQAIDTAITPVAWNQAAFSGLGVPSSSVFTPGSPCYDAATKKLIPKPSISGAQQILESDGYTLQGGVMMKNGQPLTFHIVSTPTSFENGAPYIARCRPGKQVGFQVDDDNSTGASYGNKAISQDFDGLTEVVAQSNASPAPGGTIKFFTGSAPPAGNNLGNAGGGDPVIAHALKEAYSTTGKTQCGWFDKIQERLDSQYYLDPLSAPVLNWFGNGITFEATPSIFEPWSMRKK